MRVLVSGSTGLIGRALVARLESDGHETGRLARGAGGPGIPWNPEGVTDPAPLAGWDAVVHLAGRNLATLWTPGNKRAIRCSRVAGTRSLAEAVAAVRPGPRIFVSASAVGWYGDRGEEALTEESGPGTGFLAELCRDWEAACGPARDAGARIVNLRMGIVLAGSGGPLAKMLLPFRLGLGGRMGSGRQWMSWIALTDAVRAVAAALDDDGIEGAVNVVSPEPVTNARFTKELGAALRRPAAVPVPAFALRLLPGGFGKETLLASQRAVPARLGESGFRFSFPRVGDALRAILDGKGSAAQ